MEKVNGRRRFLRGFGLGGVIAGGVASGYVASKVIGGEAQVRLPAPEPKADISHLAPTDTKKHTLTLMKDNTPPPPPVANPFNTITFPLQPDPEKSNKVVLSVGRDNQLWMETPDGWKRFVVEG